MIYTISTPATVNEVKEQIAEKAKSAGFGILKSYEFKSILEEKGFPIERDITVFELCNPAGAQQALSNIPEISAYLPCRISLYSEKQTTRLSTIGIDDIVNALNVNEDFKRYMSTLFVNLQQVMHSWDDQ